MRMGRMQVLGGGRPRRQLKAGKGWVGGRRQIENTINRRTRSMSHITIRCEENKRVTAQYQQKAQRKQGRAKHDTREILG